MAESTASRIAVIETKIENITANLDLIRDDIKDLHDCLDRTRDTIIAQIDRLKQDDLRSHQEINQRLTKLEHWRYYTIGIVTAVIFIVKLFI